MEGAAPTDPAGPRVAETAPRTAARSKDKPRPRASATEAAARVRIAILHPPLRRYGRLGDKRFPERSRTSCLLSRPVDPRVPRVRLVETEALRECQVLSVGLIERTAHDPDR